MVQTRSEATRDKVLQAAESLVIEHGHEAMAMQELVKRSGVSNGSIFHHFGSKDGVLRVIFARERRRYLGHVAQCILGHDGDPCDAMGEGARGAVEFQARDPHRHFRLVEQFSNSQWLMIEEGGWNDLAAEIERPVMEWAVPHLASGRLPMLQPHTIQSMMLGPAELVCSQWRRGRITGPLIDQAPIVARFVAQGLRQICALYAPARTA
ncbi:MAG: TetR/AcrR family transcriptional regulator [Erythrobacter sp.]|uniref:TetR/AcrR family transcriptional regulator n=1 Tax=Erythrobacter sp. TaxID=1042 RepID=UPI00261C66F0|nr:TetR/AcrR family transcriptional regulator [Erythrobacter sp.]MDJ0979797.1 TetR/AcrR family transcriptional regulator [Erythrobacter sp.]